MASFNELSSAVLSYTTESVKTEEVNNQTDLVMEGATNEINAVFKQIKSETKGELKKLKALYKAKNYKEAVEVADKLIELFEKAKKEIGNIDDTWGSMICGRIYFDLTVGLKEIGLLMIPIANMFMIPIFAIKEWIRMIDGIIRIVKEDMDTDTVGVDTVKKALNARRREVIGIIDELESVAKRIKKKSESMLGTSDAVKESVDILADAYEAFVEGGIDEEDLNDITEAVLNDEFEYSEDEEFIEASNNTKNNLKVLKAAAIAGAAGGAAGAIAGKIIDDVIVKKIIAHDPSLKNIKDKLDKCKTEITNKANQLNKAQKELKSEIRDCKEFYAYYRQLGYHTTEINYFYTSSGFKHNENYDPDKAIKWKKATANAQAKLKEIETYKKELVTLLKTVNGYYGQLKKAAKTLDEASLNKLNAACDKAIEDTNKAINDINSKMVVESTDLKLSIFEAFENGEITEEERDNLLSQI